jgi:hypothetical protein
MPWVRFEPTIPTSERAKTVHALDRSATVTGSERAKTVHALDRSATVTGDYIIRETLIKGEDDTNYETLPVDRLREAIK